VLTGLRVVEVSSFVAAPSCGLTLAQLGADVIRIDPPGGAADIDRWPLSPEGRSLYWAGLNRGKSSVVADIRSDDGRELLVGLLGEPRDGGGILVSNVNAPWLSDEALRAVRPDLINVQVLGGRGGGTGVDYTVNAASGVALATGNDDGLPVNHALPAWDLLTGLYAATTVLAAVHRRRETSEGTFATIALDDVAASVLTTLGWMPEAHLTGQGRPAIGNAIYGSFALDVVLADGKQVIVVALTTRQWQDLSAVTGCERLVKAIATELATDFSDEGNRYEHREILGAAMRPWFAARTLTEVGEALAKTSVLWSPFRTLRDHASDLAAGAGAPVVTMHSDDAIGRTLATVGPVGRPNEEPPDVAAAPTLGQDTERWSSAIRSPR